MIQILLANWTSDIMAQSIDKLCTEIVA